MASSSRRILGFESEKPGSGCLCVLCIDANGQSRIVQVANVSDCPGLWISLAENESRLSITVCEKFSHGDGCGEQPTYNFYRNANVQVIDNECVLISDPCSSSCFLFFESPEKCNSFYEDLCILLPEPGWRNDLEIERKSLWQDENAEYEEPFAVAIGRLRNLPGRGNKIIELDAGLGIVSEAISNATNADVVAVSRPGLVEHLERYFSRHCCRTYAASNIRTCQLSNVRASALVSRRLTHVLFDCDILKRFVKLRDTKLSEGARLLPSELIIRAGLIRDQELWAKKQQRATFWLTNPCGSKLSCLHNQALDEEFTVPEIDSVSERSFVSNIKESTIPLRTTDLTEESIENFNLRFEFQTTTETDVHGVAFWCSAVIDGQEVRHRDAFPKLPRMLTMNPSPHKKLPEASVACILKKFWRNVPSYCTVVVDCKFSENRARSYDIVLEYTLSEPFGQNSITKYSMMLAMPHPYGKTVHREPDEERKDCYGSKRPYQSEREEDRDKDLSFSHGLPISKGYVR